MDLRGLSYVLVTPFDTNGAVDVGSVRRVTDFAIEAGAKSVVALGVTGEADRLVDDERRAVLEAVVAQARGRVPVIAGASHGGTDGALQRTREAARLGAQAVLVTPPRLEKPNPAAVVEHYRRVGEGGLPIVVQDYPPVSGVTLTAELLVTILEKAPLTQYVKLEDPPTPQKVGEIVGRLGDRVGVFGGLSGLYLLEELARGAAGVMTGFPYPEALVEVLEAYWAGDQDAAARAFDRVLPLIVFEAQPVLGVAIRKELLRRRGVIAHAAVRAPGRGLDAETQLALTRVCERVGLLVEA